MGTCTSAARHRQKQQQHQQHNRRASKNQIGLDIKPPPPLPPLPITAFPRQQIEYPQCLYTDCDILSSFLTKPIFHQTDTNSLIQLYSSNTNNNNNNNNNSTIINWMSSSSSSVTHIPPRIPVPKTRLPVYQSTQSQKTTVTIRPKSVASTVSPNTQTESTRPLSMTNRAPPPTTMQTRFGFIPRPTAPGLQQHRGSTVASRSRSISPTSTISVNSSSSSSLVSQRLPKAAVKSPANQSIPSTSTINNTSKTKTITSPRIRDTSISKSNMKSTLHSPTAASRMRSRTPSRTSSTASPTLTLTSPVPPTSAQSSSLSNTTTTLKTDVNAIRDRYRTQKRMNFFIRHTPMSTANGSPVASSIKSPESSRIINENKQPPPPPTKHSSTNNPNNNSKAITPPQISSSHGDSAYASVTYSSNQTPSAHLSQSNRHRQRAISMLSTTSAISDVLNQDALLEDDNCSLKSDDLMCDYEETLTIDSTSRNEQTDSCSSISLTIESNKKQPTKPNVPHYQPTSRPTTITINEKSNGSLRESLDELNRLSTRMDNGIDNEHNRKFLTRSVSLKPPTSYLPPLEDAEQITMDIESYRQVMKDVMIVKTVLHQLDRLLKHSDGANMTVSILFKI
jgi:hypothetical protein